MCPVSFIKITATHPSPLARSPRPAGRCAAGRRTAEPPTLSRGSKKDSKKDNKQDAKAERAAATEAFAERTTSKGTSTGVGSGIKLENVSFKSLSVFSLDAHQPHTHPSPPPHRSA